MPKLTGATITKVAQGGLTVIKQYFDDGSQKDTPYNTSIVKAERVERIKVQKGLFDLALDLGFSEKPSDPEVEKLTQLRAIETDFTDQFDGVYSTFRILQPPVDPKALVHITQRLSIFEPIIDSMKNNVVGFGHTFHERLDFDSPEVLETLKDHFDGNLVQELETDGVRRIKKHFKRSRFVDVKKSTTPYIQHVDTAIKEAYPALEHRPLADGDECRRAIRIFKGEIRDYAEDHKVELRKIRSRTFKSRLKDMQREKRDEFLFLENFFENCNCRMSWMQIRKRMCDDFERVGAWAAEVARESKKRLPVQLGHVPIADIRLTKLGDPIMANVPCRVNKFEIVEMPRPIKFRKFVQSIGRTGRYIWFKEFGDPRIMDSRSGTYVGEAIFNDFDQEYENLFYDSVKKPTVPEDVYRTKNPNFVEANEILYYARYNAIGSPYPVPRWFGSLTLAQGMIAMEEVNASWFDNNMVPPMIVKVSDGNLNSRSEERLRSMFEERRGREKQNSVMILEAESSKRAMTFANTGKPVIEIEKMRDVIQNDATHSGYDEKGRLKIRATWRLPPAHIGQESQYTRQSISASKVAAEEQVFQPERADGDDVLNKMLMLALLVNHWQYHTNSPPVADNLQMAQVLSILGKAGFLTVGEARPEVAMILNRPLKDFGESTLTDTPFPLVLIETKVKAAMASSRGEPDNQKQKPEDQMGARPDKEGMASASEVVKSVLQDQISVTKTDTVSFDDADEQVDRNIDIYGGSFLMEEGSLYFVTRDRQGNKMSFHREIAA